MKRPSACRLELGLGLLVASLILTPLARVAWGDGSAAAGTNWSAWIEAASAATSAVVGVLLWRVTRRQAAISMRQIETVERLERPLLLVVPPLGRIGYKDAENKNVFPLFDINFQNHGRSPAIVDCWHIGIIVSSHPPVRKTYRDDYLCSNSRGEGYGITVYTKIVPSNSAVGPGDLLGWTDMKETPLKAGQVESLAKGEQHIWVDGVMLYTDVFSKPRETHFRWIYDKGLDFFRLDGGGEFNRYT